MSDDHIIFEIDRKQPVTFSSLRAANEMLSRHLAIRDRQYNDLTMAIERQQALLDRLQPMADMVPWLVSMLVYISQAKPAK